MPRKVQKSKEQKIAENYFPVDESDVKHAVEKPYKKPTIDISEISSVKVRAKKKTKRASKKKKAIKSAKKYEPQKINLKKGGYELIITEKPQAAMKIAEALGKSSKQNLHGVPYYELNRKGTKIVVACAVGHLFTLTQMQKGSGFPVFEIQWVPNYVVKKGDFTKKYYDALLTLAKGAGAITIATDYDIEGEVIGMNVMRFICNQKDANRMKFSTLTKPELNTAYETKSNKINWGQAIAGESRHFLDWFYGINLSRALMSSIKEAGRFKIMSIGRVQGPALNLIVSKERQIQEFKPQKYWQAFITINEKEKVELKYVKDIFEKSFLSKFENLIGKDATASTSKKEELLPPNAPFNLTALQMEAYRLYGLTPSRTLQIAQSLYLAGLISYPRTSSQKLPDSINYKEILEKIAGLFHAEKLISRQKPIEGPKTDPAHPSIYPTGEVAQTLNEDEEKIYNLIARRFLSLFCEDAIVDQKTILATHADLKFGVRGLAVRKKAWLEIYPQKVKETELPDLNGEFKILDSRTEEKETQPPKRYSPASIVSELEKRNLGTKATRAAILETLYDRGYIKEKSIEATPLGISLIQTLEKYSPIIIDEELTRNFEKEIDSILESEERLEEKEKKIIEDAKKSIISISKDFEKNKKEIGQGLVDAETELRAREKEESKLHPCPVCQNGILSVMYSRKTRRQFVACNAYPECKKTYSLPPNGIIKKTGKICEFCGFPTLMRLSKGKRPWTFCFNNECESNKKRLEEYQARKEKESAES